MTDQITNPLQQRASIGWFLFCCTMMLGVVVSGSDCNNVITYCKGDARDYLPRPMYVLVTLFIGLVLPLPHILVTLFFRNKGNFASVFAIAKEWHRALGFVFGGLLVLGFYYSPSRNMTDRKINIQSQHRERSETLLSGTEQERGPIASRDLEAALSLAITCASLMNKLGRIDDAVKINGYVIYKLNEIRMPEETAQGMIFDTVGKVNAFYAENFENRARVEQMEVATCSSARDRLPDFPIR